MTQKQRWEYMNFFEAMTALQNGRRVRISGWDKGVWIGLKEETFKMFGLPKSKYAAVTNTGADWGDRASFNTLLQSEWEEYKEPKAKDDSDK